MTAEQITALRRSCTRLADELVDARVPFRVALQELRYALIVLASSLAGDRIDRPQPSWESLSAHCSPIYLASQASSLDEMLDPQKLARARLKLEFIEAVQLIDWERVEQLVCEMRT